MDSARLGRLVLAKTVDRLGGLTEAALRLDIDPALLKLYVDGDRPVPDAVLLCAADQILEDLPTLTRQASDFLPAAGPAS